MKILLVCANSQILQCAFFMNCCVPYIVANTDCCLNGWAKATCVYFSKSKPLWLYPPLPTASQAGRLNSNHITDICSGL